MYKTLKRYRRDLHQIPELDFDLPLTHAYVKSALIEMGYKPKVYAKSGLVAIKEGLNKDAIAFRADMDALLITENNNVEYKSRHEGLMHACGHDGHMAILLGFAEYVSKLDAVNQSIVFVFQPAEETQGGAKVMINEGLIKDFNITKIFGIHLYPGLDEHLIGIKEGDFLSRNGEFKYTIDGKGAHGGRPHEGIDAILAGSDLVQGLNQIVSKHVAPNQSAVISVGTFNGGTASNVIADQATISGTIRAFEDDVFNTIKDKMNDIKVAIELQYDVSIEEEIDSLYPKVYNDQSLFNMVDSILKDSEKVSLSKFTFSEDFAFYQEEIPGLFVFLGTRNTALNYTYALHNPNFNFDEKVLETGVNLFIKISQEMKLFD